MAPQFAAAPMLLKSFQGAPVILRDFTQHLRFAKIQRWIFNEQTDDFNREPVKKIKHDSLSNRQQRRFNIKQ